MASNLPQEVVDLHDSWLRRSEASHGLFNAFSLLHLILHWSVKTLLYFLLSLSMPLFAEPFIVAHRGASGEAPENTLKAFLLAWEQGADAIEGDFHLTRDERIVCFHDRTTKKLTGKDLTINKSTLAELQTLDAGSWKGKDFAGTRIPTIEQVLDCVPPGKQIFIEVKCGPEIIPALIKAVKQSGLTNDQVVVISFQKNVVKALKKQVPDWTVNWLYSFDARASHDPDKKLPHLLATLAEIKANGLGSSSHPGLSKGHLDSLNRKGFQHHVWTVNDPATAQRFITMGCRSITTDYPGALRKGLKRPLDTPLP